MHKWKILIADDEEEARELLLYYLQEWNIADIKECSDGSTTLQTLQSFQPDILFLDIKMPEVTGIEVLQNKQQSLLPAIIFTTAFDEYALPAFDYEAIDYLLKPFEQERFNKALKRAMDYVELIKSKTKSDFLLHVSVKTGSRTDLVPVNDILYFQAEGPYVQVITNNKTFLIPESMYELESALDPAEFYRVHRSVIVNTKYVKSIRSLLNGDHMLILENGKEVRASRTYRERINNLKHK